MIKPFLYIVFLVSFASTAQNLVPNGSFEEYSECPEEREYNNGQFERCKGWWYPTNYGIGTPDYYNVCNNFIGGSNQGVVGVPTNSRGYQQPYDGKGMLGLAAISVHTLSQTYEVYEIVSCRLKETLKSCHAYQFSCYVNLAETSTYGIDGLGFACTTDSLVLNSFDDIFDISPQWYSELVVIDTANWIKLQGSFVATGGEQFLHFGSFFPKEETNWLPINTGSIIQFDAAYYFLDSVSCIEIKEVVDCIPSIPNVFTPNADFANDEYTISGLNISQMVIFNRWGNIICILNEDQQIWDGTFQGKPCSEGSYFYRANFGETYLTGFIELIR